MKTLKKSGKTRESFYVSVKCKFLFLFSTVSPFRLPAILETCIIIRTFRTYKKRKKKAKLISFCVVIDF